MLEVTGASREEVRNLASPALPLLEVEPFGAALHVRVAEDGPPAGRLADALVASGARDARVVEVPVTLEDVFLRVVGGAS
jgi:hypothetical protein